ncbi:MAG: ATP-binding protein [Opitutales bacterium]
MESLIQMFGLKHLDRDVSHRQITLPPSHSKRHSQSVHAGTLLYSGKAVSDLFLSPDNFRKHIGIYGITGSGKTNCAYHLIQGLAKRNIPVLIIDWKRSYRTLQFIPDSPLKDIKVFTLGRKGSHSLSWNPFRGPPGIHPQTWLSVVGEVLEKSHIAGQGVFDVFIEVFDQIFDEYGVYEGDVAKYPNFFDAMDHIQKFKSGKGRRGLWQDSFTRIFRSFTFGPAAGAFNARNPIKLEELLSEKIIFELDQELPKALRAFFSELILRFIHLVRLHQGETERLRHVIVLEEVHNLFPKSSIEKQTTNSLEILFKEVRGFGQGLINITQNPSLIPLYIIGNSNTQFFMTLSHEDDIMAAKRALFLQPGEEPFLDRLATGEGLVKIHSATSACHIRVPKVNLVQRRPDAEENSD